MSKIEERIKELEELRLSETLTEEKKTAITNELMELQAIRNNDAAFDNAQTSTEATVDGAKTGFYFQLAGLIVSTVSAFFGIAMTGWVSYATVQARRGNVTNGTDIDCTALPKTKM